MANPQDVDSEDYLRRAREIAAQCWCDDENSKTEMDVNLAESMAKRIAPLLKYDKPDRIY